MSLFDAFRHRLRPLFRRRDFDREMAEEFRHHLDLQAQELSDADGASATARAHFGSQAYYMEETRRMTSLGWLDVLLADLRQAARALGANRGFAAVAILSLALGIGANTAIFSLINTVMLKSLPVRHPETLLKVTMGNNDEYFTNPLWEQLRDHPELYAGAFAYNQTSVDLARGGEKRSVDGEWVSGNYFATLGVSAIAGRTITGADDVRGCPAVAVLSYGLWQNEFGGDRSAIGKTLMVNSHPFTVVGVVDRAFFGMDVGRQTQLYAPICAAPTAGGVPATALEARNMWWLNIVARRAAGATVAQTNARFAAVAPSVFQATAPLDQTPQDVAEYLKRTLSVAPAAAGFSDLRLQYAGALRVLMVVVALVLLIACANVANLLLARATVRQHEAAIRLALGAGRARLIRLMLTEAMLISLLGAALGVLFASWGTRVLMSLLSAGDDGTWLDLALDRRVLAFTMLAALVSGVLFGLAPAWRSANADPQDALKSQGRSVVGRGRRHVGLTLVAGQVALSFVLLTSAGLLLNSFRNLTTTNAGFRRSGVLLVNTELSDTNPTLTAVILERMRALPGVRSAAFSTMTPLSGGGQFSLVALDGAPLTTQAGARTGIQSAFNRVSANYFATMGTRVLRGRDVSPVDDTTSPPVALLSEGLARKLFGSADPIGRRLRGRQPIEVIGVVEDARFGSLRDTVSMMVYLPARQAFFPLNEITLELRSDVPPATLITGVKNVMAGLSPTASLEFTTLSDQVARSLSRDRLLATLATFFGGLALVLALIGLYGTMSYNVARRKNEIGIRIALGAARERVIRMVIGEVSVVVVAGLALGALLALAATRLVASFLFGLTASDPVTWIASGAVLLVVALLAGAAPAWRAARMNPMSALREE